VDYQHWGLGEYPFNNPESRREACERKGRNLDWRLEEALGLFDQPKEALGKYWLGQLKIT
jgi:hypothetical protein